MKNSKFFVVAATAALLLTACKPAEISNEQAKARLSNIAKAYETTDVVPEVKAFSAKTYAYSYAYANINGEKKTEEHSSTAYVAMSAENLISESYVEVDGEKGAHLVTYFDKEESKQYVVDMVNKKYTFAEIKLPEVEVEINVEIKTNIQELAGEFIGQLQASIDLNKSDYLKELQAQFGQLADDIIKKFNVGYYSDGEGQLVADSDIAYSFEAAIGEQKTSLNGKQYTYVGIDNYLPTTLSVKAEANSKATIGGKTSEATSKTEASIDFNYNASIRKPNLNGFENVTK